MVAAYSWLLLGYLGLLVSAQRTDPSPYKGYSGFRLSKNSVRAVYHNDQTIAVVELGSDRRLLNCELIEVYKDSEKKGLLFNLTRIAKPYAIKFSDMMDLMDKCNGLDTPDDFKSTTVTTPTDEGRTSSSNTLLNGIIPGTKWCGTGDIAETYFDLGEEENIDRCCRSHDLCPAKVRAYTARYNLTNNSVYTKSHCKCDAIFHSCLKSSGNPIADVMGNIYFNILRVPCVQNQNDSDEASFKLPAPY